MTDLVWWLADILYMSAAYTGNPDTKEEDWYKTAPDRFNRKLKARLSDTPDGSLDVDAIMSTIDNMSGADSMDIYNLVLLSITPDDKAATPKAPVLQQRIPVISTAIKRLRYPHLKIPYGGKAKVMEICMEGHPDLFPSKDVFNTAWKTGKKETPQLWEVANLGNFKNN